MKKVFFAKLKEGQKAFGDDIAEIVNTALLSAVYVLGVGLTSLAARIFGKKFLNLQINKNAKTYWEDLNLGKKKTEEYYRQF